MTTCTTARNGAVTNSQTDYVMANVPMVNFTTVDTPSETRLDHLPLLGKALITYNSKDVFRNTAEYIKIPRKNLTDDQLLRIFMHRDWPRRPFNVIAYSLGYGTLVNTA